jgi:isoprenylcysteine carboxyl methyltransferase (ICMT) family protein YpbQ
MKVFSLVLAIAILFVALHFAAGLSAFVDAVSIAFIAIPAFAAFVAQGFKKQGIQVVRDISIQVAIVGNAHWIRRNPSKYVRPPSSRVSVRYYAFGRSLWLHFGRRMRLVCLPLLLSH